MRLYLDSLHDAHVLTTLAPYRREPWVQQGHTVPLSGPLPQDMPWLHGQEGLLDSSAFGYFCNAETGRRVYVSLLLSQAVGRKVQDAWAAAQARREHAQPLAFWRRGLWPVFLSVVVHHTQRQRDAKAWAHFFAVAVATLDAHPTLAKLSDAVGRGWSADEVALTARRLECRSDARTVAKALKAAGRDALIPF